MTYDGMMMSLFHEILATLLVLLGLHGWGRQVLQRVQAVAPLNFAYPLVLGSGLWALTLAVLGPFFSLRGLSLFLVGGGTGLWFWDRYTHRSPDLFRFHLNPFRLPLPVWAYLGGALLLGFYPSVYHDPLNYHLFGAVRWLQKDRISFIADSIPVAHDSFADYLYLPLGALFDLSSVEGLLSFQISAQWMTIVLGIGVSSLFLENLLRDRLPWRWLGLVMVAALTRASLQHKGLMAKSDWICLSWFLAGILFYQKSFLSFPLFLSDLSRRTGLLAAGLFWGLAFGTRPTFAAPFVFLGLVVFFQRRDEREILLKNVPLLLPGLVLTLGLFGLRNAFWTGNPLFPMAHRIFPSSFLGPSWITGFQDWEPGLHSWSWDFFARKLDRIVTYDYINILFFFFPLFWKRSEPFWKGLWMACLGTVFFFIFVMGSNVEMRHLAPAAVAVNILAIFVLWQITRLGISPRLIPGIRTAVYLLILINIMRTPAEINPFPPQWRKGDFSRVGGLREEGRGLETAAWVTAHLPEARLGVFDDTPLYYLANLKIVKFWDEAQWDRELSSAKNLQDLLNLFSTKGLTHLLETQREMDPLSPMGIRLLLRRFVGTYPEVVVFQKGRERVISLSLVQAALERENQSQKGKAGAR